MFGKEHIVLRKEIVAPPVPEQVQVLRSSRATNYELAVPSMAGCTSSGYLIAMSSAGTAIASRRGTQSWATSADAGQVASLHGAAHAAASWTSCPAP